jgi:hypothetical protein
MKFQFYYEKLLDSEDFKKFKKENPTAFFCSGFFALDLEENGKSNQVNFDMFLEKPKKKMFTFKVSGKTELLPVENFDPRVPEELSMNYDFDLMKIKDEIQTRMEEDKIKGKMKKMLFSLQKLKNVDYLVITVFLDNMAMLKATYDIADKKIVSIEKKSFLDMFKIIKGNKNKDSKVL